jgi:hypothetical protein
MSQPVQDDWVLDEAEALLDMDGRRERLDLVVADLQSGKIQPVDHATARDRIEKRIRGCYDGSSWCPVTTNVPQCQ